MNSIIDRLVLLLAGTNWSYQEIRALHEIICKVPADELVWRIDKLQSMLSNSIPRGTEKQKFYAESNWTVGDRVSKLLREEATLSTTAAHSLLVKALLREKLISAQAIPPVSKKSFSAWVDRLAQVTSPKDLLRISTEIRNTLVGDDSADWITTSSKK